MSRVQASEKEIEMLEAEIMFCLIKNPTFIKDFKETLTDLDFSDEFFQKSLWKINTNRSPKQQRYVFLFPHRLRKKTQR